MGTPSHAHYHTAFYPSNLPPTPYSCHLWIYFFSAQAEADSAADSFSPCPLPLKAPECWWKAPSDLRTRTTPCRWLSGHQEMQLRWKTAGVLEIPISSSGAPSAADPIHLEWFWQLSLFPDMLGQELSHTVLFSDALLQSWGTMALWPRHKPWHGGSTMELLLGDYLCAFPVSPWSHHQGPSALLLFHPFETSENQLLF